MKIPEGRLIESITIAECPSCKKQNRFHWVPGMEPVCQDYFCNECGTVYSLRTDV